MRTKEIHENHQLKMKTPGIHPINPCINQGKIDVGDKWMLVTSGCWCHRLDKRARRLCSKKEDAGDKNGQNRHQHLKVVVDTFHPEHPAPISMLHEF